MNKIIFAEISAKIADDILTYGAKLTNFQTLLLLIITIMQKSSQNLKARTISGQLYLKC